MNLDLDRLAATSLPLPTSWLLAACLEARGKQELLTRQKPELLAALREQAVIQSVESSNRIEGVTISAARRRPVIISKARPRNRSEEELAGYRRALAWIFTRMTPVLPTPSLIRKLHALAQGGPHAPSDTGKWKTRDNQIIEILPSGDSRVRFTPTSARDTPRAIELLCRNYARIIALEDQPPPIPPLLAAATFIFDFLCIHPFRDGNGRVSRLLTTLLLQNQNFQVARYLSLERLVEESREDYYRVLAECSRHWNQDRNQIIPWWNYFLGILRSAYRDLEFQVEAAAPTAAKGDLVRRTILDQPAPFTLAELTAQLPAVSPQLIKKVLSSLKQERLVQLTGRGRSARWQLS